ncbi:MAG: glycine cleavage system aminomethyltransferase GcvT [Chloroflexi bacterium]|nr:glycine cleavage system aminomethyltransferase GcvT [Chloroflexota bacterium]
MAAKIEGPVVIEEKKSAAKVSGDAGTASSQQIDLGKPYFVGQRALLAQKTTAVSSKKPFCPEGYTGEPRRSSLYDEHIRLNNGRNMVPFADWVMPVWYSSIREEHRAVREAAGIFDISHMGVLEVRGQDAGRFLDLVTTNYVPSLSPGQSHYSYILDPDGNVLDDVFLYCRALDRYMLVVNAANAERVESWLRAVNSRRYLIDRERPGVAVDAEAEIRNLKDIALGDEGRVDIALQGPASLKVLWAAIDDVLCRERLAKLRKTEFVEGEIATVPALISRTGYTGEDIGFELYVPPTKAPRVWRQLLEVGGILGLRAAGLGARDSTRVEAGFPLYGHELAGRYGISPAGAGYGQFVKLHKPFFVGRRAFARAEEQRASEIVRFRLSNKGARMLRPGDPVVDGRGECLGHVTSSVAVDGIQVGMAYVSRERLRPGDTFKAFPLSRWKDGGEKPKAELGIGDVVLLAEDAVVLPRFGLKTTSDV